MEGNKKTTNITRNVVASNLLWRFLERFGAYVVSFVISIVLARILDPSTYGVVALMTVVISFLDIFVTAGFANSLIYNKEATDKDFNTLFVFNIIFSLTLYTILFFVSPLIASYYEKPILTWLIRVSGISLLINGFKNLQYAFVAKRLQFKKFFKATIIGTIVSGVVGIVMALTGFGAWALVVQGVLNHFIDTLILFFVIEWKPKLYFSFKLFWKHFKFGWKILVSKIVYNISNSARQLVIGKKFSDSDLAFFNKGKTYPNIIGQNVTTTINSVIYPVLTRSENDKKRFNEMLLKSFKINMFVVLPLMIGFFCVSESFVHILLGTKWLPAVPYIRIFCFVIILNCIDSIFSSAPLALGRSGLNMILDIVECFISIGLLVVALPYGVMAIAISLVLSSFINCLIFMIAVKILTGFKISNCLISSFDTIVSTALMGVLVISLFKLPLPFYVIFLLQIVVGIISYWFLNKAFKNESLTYCLDIMKTILKKKKIK